MYSSVLATEEKVLIHMQRSAVISSDSTEDPETDYGAMFGKLHGKV
jgi:hypothetical protein